MIEIPLEKESSDTTDVMEIPKISNATYASSLSVVSTFSRQMHLIYGIEFVALIYHLS